MPQRLTLPIEDTRVNAGYGSARYLKEWGFNHYGVDLVSESKIRTLRAMGDGIVHSCGMDGATSGQRLGRCIVIVYNDVLLNDDKTVKNLACRLFHLDKILVKPGERVNAFTLLGEYGNTGAHSSGTHLHIEFDTDIDYPQYAYGISASGNVIKKGPNNTTIDPQRVFWIGRGQSISLVAQWIADGWMSKAWYDVPDVPITPVTPPSKIVSIADLRDMGYVSITL